MTIEAYKPNKKINLDENAPQQPGKGQNTGENSSSRPITMYFDTNPLEKAHNPTYNFNLYLISFSDYLQGKYRFDDAKRKIIIAKTGTTGYYNLQDVEIQGVVGLTERYRSNLNYMFDIKVLEVQGMTFLDKINLAAAELGWPNFAVSPFYLELSFAGYDERTGIPAPGILTAERRTWSLRVRQIKPDVSPAGGHSTWTISANPFAEQTLNRENFVIGQEISFFAETIGEFFQKLQDQMNKHYVTHNEYIEQFPNRPTNDEFFKFVVEPELALVKLIKNKATSETTDTRDSIEGGHHFTFDSSKDVNDLLNAVIVAADQEKLKEIVLRTSDSNKTELKYYPLIPRIITRTKILAYDTVTNDYIRQNIYFVVMVDTPGLSIHKPEENENIDQSTFLETLNNKYQFCRKAYEWAFTGKNTSVIEPRFDYDALWYLSIGYNPRASRISRNATVVTPQEIDKPEGGVQMDQDIERLSGFPGQSTSSTQAKTQAKTNRIISLDQAGTDAYSTQHAEDIPLEESVELPYIRKEDKDLDLKKYRDSLEVQTDTEQQNWVNNLLQAAYESPALLSMELEIIGDPYWLGVPDDEFGLEESTDKRRKTAREIGFLTPRANFDYGQHSFIFDFMVPSQLNERTGMIDLNKNNSFRGLYNVYKVDHRFNDGKFTQVLHAKRNIMIEAKTLNLITKAYI